MTPIEQLKDPCTDTPESMKYTTIRTGDNARFIRFSLSAEEIPYFYQLTNHRELSQFAVLAAMYELILRTYFEDVYHGLAVYISLNDKQLSFPFNGIQRYEGQTFRQLLQSIGQSIQQTLVQAERGDILPLGQDQQFTVSFNNAEAAELYTGGLLFAWQVNRETLNLDIHYSEQTLHTHVVMQMAAVFRRLLMTLQLLPEQRLCDISCVSAEDEQLVTVTFNNTAVAYPDQETIVSLFERTVATYPDRIAVGIGDSGITYASLNQQANRFAHYLRNEYDVRPDETVGIKLVRSEWMIITIIGILKAGAAYVPIDPNYPAARIQYIAENSGSSITIDEVVLEKFRQQQDLYPVTDPVRVNSPGDLVYVIYTSGTTGNPKGVMITHGALVNRLVWMQKAYALGEDDTILQKTTYSFDVSVWELLWWGLYGAKVAVPEPGAEKDPASLVNNIAQHEVTVLHFVPSMLAVFLEYLTGHAVEKQRIGSLKQVFVSGEALSLHQQNTFLRELPGIGLINLYGPTEASIDVSSYDCLLTPAIGAVPIGKPIDNIRLYILNNELQLLPVGVAGKLYIAGIGVARGYRNNPGLTEEKFIKAPFAGETVLYDTGDIARWLPDGNIEYLGRKDHQVKIRGYRIEFGEIEYAASRYGEGIKQVVADTKAVNGEKVLVLYYTATGTPDKTGLKDFMRRHLPEYMVPAYFVQLEQIPLTPNGKADRKALPDVAADNLVRQDYVAPRNELEQQLVEIWQEVLRVERVGVTDNFFELGGHSLLIGQTINQMYKRLSQTVTFRDFLETPDIAHLSNKLSNIRYTPLPVFPVMDSYPVSAAQQRLWILSQLDGGVIAYNIAAGLEIRGALSRCHLAAAVQTVIARHEILRTCFRPDAQTGEIRQFVMPVTALSFQLDIVSAEEIDHFSNHAFDLAKAPLLKVGIAEGTKGNSIFLLLIHHIISDGWSVEIMLDEILEAYNVLQQNANPNFALPSFQYKDYVLWQEGRKEETAYTEQENYWLGQFQDDISQLNLPALKKRPARQSFNGATRSFVYPDGLYKALQRLSLQHQASLFMTIMTAVKALLYRYTGQRDIIIGTPIAGRQHPDIERGIGLFLNTLPIRTVLGEDWTFADLLREEKRQLTNAYVHQEYPFDELISKLQLKTDRSRSALFDVMVVLHNQSGMHVRSKRDGRGMDVKEYKVDTHTSHFDMTFSFQEKDGLALELTYNTDIYDERIVDNIFSHLGNIFDLMISAPESRIAAALYLGQPERNMLLSGFNDTTVLFPQDKTWLDLFREQVAYQPDHVAVKDSGTVYTYQQLDVLSDNIARYIAENVRGKAHTPVAVMVDRSADMILLLLGIHKAGRPYIPLDPFFPADRIDYVIKDSGVDLLIVADAYKHYTTAALKIIGLEVLLSATQDGAGPAMALRPSPDDTAYIIYTSGSTGHPKGIEIGHRSLLNLLISMAESPGMHRKDIVFAVTSYSFDISVADFFTALITGATLYVAEQWLLSDPPALIGALQHVAPTFMQATPSFYQLLKDNSWQGSDTLKVLCGGDVFSDSLGAFLLDSCKEVWNMYGPTETTVYSCLKKIAHPEDVASIGKPINNTVVYILDDYRQPVPVGVIGNMYIAGAGLAKCYYKNEALTRQKFVSDPFSGGSMYETGDVAKWNHNGDIIFLGRNDHQVKIRGFRVELGEIESLLVKLPGIRDAIVLLNGDLLVAYVLTDTLSYSKEDVITALKQKLTHYMVPHVIIPLNEFPLTPSRKTDRKALLRIPLTGYLSTDQYIPAANINEENILTIWKGILNLEQIGVTDNFFELGGNSIRAFRMINQVNQQYAATLKIRDILEAPSIRELSLLLETSPLMRIPVIRQRFDTGQYCMLSSNQRRLWILDNSDSSSNAYNITNGLLIGANFDPQRFAVAYAALCHRHESFRTRFVFDERENIPVQYVEKEVTPAIEWETYDYMPSEPELTAILNQENNYRFDLTKAPLSKLKIIKLPEDRYFVVIVMHHLISDAWSMDILLQEWLSLYQDAGTVLPEPAFTYRDFSIWQQAYYGSEGFEETAAYWEHRLQNGIENIPVLQQQGHPMQSDNNAGATISFSVEKKVFEELRQMAAAHQVSMFSLVITGFNVLMHYISGKQCITLGTSVAGRPRQEFEPVIGFFINTLPISLHVDPSLTFKELLLRCNRHIINDIHHQDISLDELLSRLNKPRKDKLRSLFQGRFVFSEETFDAVRISQTTGISSIKRSYPDQADVKFDFSLNMKVAEGNLSGIFEFRTAMYDKDFIELVIQCYTTILAMIANDSDLPVTRLNTFSEDYAAYLKKKNASLQSRLFDSFSNFKKHNDEKHPRGSAQIKAPGN